jgi:hypothetical protein
MDKPTQKKVTNWNREAINILSERMSLGKDYIKKVIRDERTPVNADTIKREYKLVCHNLNALKTIEKLK